MLTIGLLEEFKEVVAPCLKDSIMASAFRGTACVNKREVKDFVVLVTWIPLGVRAEVKIIIKQNNQEEMIYSMFVNDYQTELVAHVVRTWAVTYEMHCDSAIRSVRRKSAFEK
jgi:hypothetical protein